MSTFDVRTQKPDELTVIKFADEDNGYVVSTHLSRADDEGIVCINDEHDDYMYIRNEEDAECLILALRKAIELDWFKVSE